MKYWKGFLLLSVLFLASCSSSDLSELSGDWVAEQLSSGDLDCTEELDDEYILDIDRVSRSYGLQLDINSCGGSLSGGRGGNIEFKDPACTEACCDSEGALCLLDALLLVDEYDLQSDVLVLTGSSVRIEFSRRD